MQAKDTINKKVTPQNGRNYLQSNQQGIDFQNIKQLKQLSIKANKATEKELISKIYKQLLQLNSTKINDPIKEKKMGQRTKQIFLQR